MSYKTNLLLQTDTFFHIYNRGANRSKIFFSHDNYVYFLQKLRKYRDQFNIAIICYCLMPNHFHLLLLQKVENSISNFMKLTTNSYVKAINKRLGRSGHLFEGDYNDFIGGRKGRLPEIHYIMDEFKSVREYIDFVKDFQPNALEIIKKYIFE